MTTFPARLLRLVRDAVEQLAPGCFAIVMATGIVSIDLQLHGMPRLAQALLALNAVLWLWLVFASLWRILAWPGRVREDFRSPARGPGFLTFSAGTLVLASQCVVVLPCPRIAVFLLGLGVASWLALLYSFLATSMTAVTKPRFADSINGGWLILVVATQAVAVALIEAGPVQPVFRFTALSLYMLGGALYLILITLLFFRLVFRPLRADDLTPPYWINMGALAITTLAGSLLVEHAGTADALATLAPFVLGFTVFFWATATWWIPLLLLLGLWRHLLQRVPLRYEGAYWNMVFPISMYMVGTFHLAAALNAPFLRVIPAAGVHLGFAVWLVVALGGLHAGLARVARRDPGE